MADLTESGFRGSSVLCDLNSPWPNKYVNRINWPVIKRVGRSGLNGLSEVDWMNETSCMNLSVMRSDQCWRWMGSMWCMVCMCLTWGLCYRRMVELSDFLHECAKNICLKGMCMFPVPSKAGGLCVRIKCVHQLGCALWSILVSVCSNDCARIDR